MSEPSSGPPDTPPVSFEGQDPSSASTGRHRSPVRSVGIPALLGAAFGTLIGVVWRALTEPGRPAEDTLGLLFLAAVLGLPVLVAVSWAALVLAGPAWVGSVVTIAGLAAGTYTVGLHRTITGTSAAPSVALCALSWGASYATVALACLPRVPRPVRGAVVALLVAPAVLFLVL